MNRIQQRASNVLGAVLATLEKLAPDMGFIVIAIPVADRKPRLVHNFERLRTGYEIMRALVRDYDEQRHTVEHTSEEPGS